MDLICESQKLLYVSIILKRKLSNMEEKCNLQWDLISTYYSPKMFGKKSFLRIPNILENLLLKRTFQEIWIIYVITGMDHLRYIFKCLRESIEY